MTGMSNIQQQGAQIHESNIEVLPEESTCDFVDTVTPKNNGQSRVSTEYHPTKFVSCFRNNINDLNNEEGLDVDSEEEDSEEEDSEDK
mmetsp:Transcript_9789/g.14522  ORF Transcript_9789/g.14522 Transcript_9789/m.14522 type:complete len:88 (-) Transcript_9789:70-333(-)